LSETSILPDILIICTNLRTRCWAF